LFGASEQIRRFRSAGFARLLRGEVAGKCFEDPTNHQLLALRFALAGFYVFAQRSRKILAVQEIKNSVHGAERLGEVVHDAVQQNFLLLNLLQELFVFEQGIPRGWVARMRESMARLTPAFSTNRAVRQYTEEHYLSAVAAFRQRAENRGSLGADLVGWRAELAKHWSALRFGPTTVEQQGEQYLFHVQVFLDDVDPDAVRVELYADAQKKDDAPVTLAMNRGEVLVGATNAFSYSASVPTSRPLADYTPRLVAQHVGAFVPLETPFILWHEAPSWRRTF